MKLLRSAAMALLAGSITVLGPSLAHAETVPNEVHPSVPVAQTTNRGEDGIAVTELAYRPVASLEPLAASTTCQYGTYKGRVSASLSGGTITTTFCRYDNGRISQVNTNYYKSGGNNVVLRNIWEWTNSAGSTMKERKWDVGQFTAAAGKNYPFTWRYAYPGLSAPTMTPCTRGGVFDIKKNYPYTTRVLC